MPVDPKDARDRAEEHFEKALPTRGYWSGRRIAVALVVAIVVVIAGVLAFG